MSSSSSSNQNNSSSGNGGSSSHAGSGANNKSLDFSDYFKIGSWDNETGAGKLPAYDQTLSIPDELVLRSNGPANDKMPPPPRPIRSTDGTLLPPPPGLPDKKTSGKYPSPSVRDMQSTGFSIARPRDPQKIKGGEIKQR